MKIENIEPEMPVLYIPRHKLIEGQKDFEDNQLGIVSSVSDKFAFVRYKGTSGSQATNPEDLFPLNNRPDLLERLGIEILPTNKINELYLKNKTL